MRLVFADTWYWLALLNPRDEHHALAKRMSSSLSSCRIFTTELVLMEMLDGLSAGGETLRKAAVDAIGLLERSSNTTVLSFTADWFRSTVEFYGSRLDKDWGATDCASFLMMTEKGLAEVLTNDHHFTQAGCVLVPDEPTLSR